MGDTGQAPPKDESSTNIRKRLISGKDGNPKNLISKPFGLFRGGLFAKQVAASLIWNKIAASLSWGK